MSEGIIHFRQQMWDSYIHSPHTSKTNTSAPLSQTTHRSISQGRESEHSFFVWNDRNGKQRGFSGPNGILHKHWSDLTNVVRGTPHLPVTINVQISSTILRFTNPGVNIEQCRHIYFPKGLWEYHWLLFSWLTNVMEEKSQAVPGPLALFRGWHCQM